MQCALVYAPDWFTQKAVQGTYTQTTINAIINININIIIIIINAVKSLIIIIIIIIIIITFVVVLNN